MRALAKQTEDAAQSRRLLALAEIYNGDRRRDDARTDGMQLQTVRDWVLRFNDRRQRRSSRCDHGSGSMVYRPETRCPGQSHPDSASAATSGAQPCSKYMAVHARELILEQDFCITREFCRLLQRGVEPTYRSAMDCYIHR